MNVLILYRNWKGEVGWRRILPLGFRYGTSEWHPRPQYLIQAWDLDKDAGREFAWEDILFTARPDITESEKRRVEETLLDIRVTLCSV